MQVLNGLIEWPVMCLDVLPESPSVFQPKDIVHLWELGGCTSLSELVQIPITADNVRSAKSDLLLPYSDEVSHGVSCIFHHIQSESLYTIYITVNVCVCVCVDHRALSVVLVLDLSKPNSMWGTMERLLQATRAQVEKACSQPRRTGESQASSKHQALNNPPRVLPKDHCVRTPNTDRRKRHRC